MKEAFFGFCAAGGGKAAEGAVFAEDAVAGDNQGEGILGDGIGDSADGFGVMGKGGDFGVTYYFSII